MKWYQEWQQNARNRYLEGYYPGHKRVPNPIVLSLYGIGYFFGDFVPLILNLINGIYWAIKRLVAFVVGLLIEASIFIVLAGSVVFSVFHSIDRMRVAGATGGLEYVGVLMFEVIFIGSAATLTGFLMKKRLPRGFIEWLGLSFTILGFFVGLAFVWWSNFQGMAPTIEGRIIGSAVPLLVLIGEGVLAYRFIIENKEEVSLQELIRRNQLSTDEVKSLIEDHVKKQREKAALKHKETPPVVEEKKPITEKKKWWKNWFKKKPKTKTILDDKNDSEVQEKADAQDVETGAETNAEMNTQSETKPDAEADVKMDVEMDTESPAQADAQTDAKPDGNADAGVDIQVDTEADAETDVKADAKVDTQTDANADAKTDTKVDTKEDTDAGAETSDQVDVKMDAMADTKLDTKMGAKVDTQAGAKVDAKEDTQLDAQADAETGIKADVKTDAQVGVETGVKVGAQMDAKEDTDAGAKPDTEADTNVDVEVDIISGANTGAMADTKEGVEVGAKVDTQIDAQPDTQVDAIVDTKEDTDAGAESGAVDGANTDSQANTTTDTKPKQRRGKKNTAADDPDFKKVKRWARRFQKERGKLPGRVEIQKKFDGFGKSQCTKYAAMLKEELGEAS
jgi:hypothetical protein